ncbi:GGDEF domain-containing protein [Roseibium salinum]|nr:GGDEF domain-containing protein [Roseibium salinum]
MVEGKTEEETKIILICRDVTSQVEHMKELEAVRSRLKHQAEHDDLTGVANRAKLTSFLQERVSAAAGPESLIGIVHVDLDHFKDINDSHGHCAGDTVLRHTADVLKSVMGDKGLVARIGGDEFVAVVSDPLGPEEMETIGKKILDGLAKPVKVDHQNLKVAGSVGLVLADGTKASSSELIHRADLALYAAKKSGRSQFAWYTDALGAAHRHKRMTMAQLDQDLEKRSPDLAV